MYVLSATWWFKATFNPIADVVPIKVLAIFGKTWVKSALFVGNVAIVG